MKRVLKSALLAGLLMAATLLIHCSDDSEVVCTGCDDPNFPWSAPGSTECYETRNDCQALENGTCSVCI